MTKLNEVRGFVQRRAGLAEADLGELLAERINFGDKAWQLLEGSAEKTSTNSRKRMRRPSPESGHLAEC